MSAHDPLDDLRQRLASAEAARARQKNAAQSPGTDSGEGTSKGFRLAIEFAVPVLVGTGFGLWLDRRLETLPWFTLIFILLGFGAGIMNVFRLAGGYGAVGYRTPQSPLPPPDQTTDEDKTPREQSTSTIRD